MSIKAFYNEIDPYCCAWLSNLMDAGHITPGKIDDRSIEDICPDELIGYNRVHMFAGVGVWDYALNLAGWGESEVWTGSCPCQPFSTAGKGAGFDDERHLWPAFHHLIKECKPPKIFGEQVASKDANPWIDLVHADLEALGYAFGCVPFPSAGVGAPHIRDRNYWVAHAEHQRLDGRRSTKGRNDGFVGGAATFGGASGPQAAGLCALGGLADTGGERRFGRQRIQAGGFDDRAHAGRIEGNDGPIGIGEAGVFGSDRPGPINGYWRDADWLFCRDGKWRPVESGAFPLVNGAPARVGRLRAYGNAINAQQAAEFIRAAM